MSEDTQELKGFDVEGALARVAGNKNLYRKLLGMFAQNYKSAGEDLDRLVSGGSMEEARALAHTIKGVAGNIGATDLFEAAKVLNETLVTGDYTTEQVETFKTALVESIKTAQEF